MMANLINLRGRMFGVLKVLKQAPSDAKGNARWLCLCVCGAEKIVYGHHLRSGHTKSCGCCGRDHVIEAADG